MISVSVNQALVRNFLSISEGVSEFVNVLTHLDNQTLSAEINGSYQCTSSVSLSLNNSIILRFYDLKYRAFGKGNSTWFSDTGKLHKIIHV